MLSSYPVNLILGRIMKQSIDPAHLLSSYPVNLILGRIMKQSYECVLDIIIVRFRFFIFLFLTADRSIRHCGVCDGERVKEIISDNDTIFTL